MRFESVITTEQGNALFETHKATAEGLQTLCEAMNVKPWVFMQHVAQLFDLPDTGITPKILKYDEMAESLQKLEVI